MIWPAWLPELSAWIPALTTSTMLAAAGIIFGPIYKAAVEKGIQHKLDAKLEAIRSELRRDEEEQKAETRRHDEQIAALRSGILSGMTTRYASLDKRRLEAVERLWGSICELSPLKGLAQWTKVMKLDKILEVASNGTDESIKMRSFLDTMWQTHSLEKIKDINYPAQERPFISHVAWVYYVTYRQILYYPYTVITIGRIGMDHGALQKPDEILGALIQMLPHQADFINKMGVNTFPYLIDEIEQVILTELTSNLSGEDSDSRGIEQASKIFVSAMTAFAPAPPAIDREKIPPSILS